MLSPFDAAESRMNAAINLRFGKTVTLLPTKRRPNQEPIEDRSRDPQMICGTFNTNPTLHDLDKNSRVDRAGRSAGSMSFNSMSTKITTLDVRLCDLVWEPRQHDRVLREEDQILFEITDVKFRGHSDLTLVLTETGGNGPYAIAS